jgi:ubiquinone/menaquinone biosynthesis C-methylase UbiE
LIVGLIDSWLISSRRYSITRSAGSKKEVSQTSSTICATESLFRFVDNTFDRIFLVTVLGEVENQSAYLGEFRGMLKTGGILSISELAGDPDKIPAESLRKLTASAGFSFCRLYGSKWNYTMNVTTR